MQHFGCDVASSLCHKLEFSVSWIINNQYQLWKNHFCRPLVISEHIDHVKKQNIATNDYFHYRSTCPSLTSTLLHFGFTRLHLFGVFHYSADSDCSVFDRLLFVTCDRSEIAVGETGHVVTLRFVWFVYHVSTFLNPKPSQQTVFNHMDALEFCGWDPDVT